MEMWIRCPLRLPRRSVTEVIAPWTLQVDYIKIARSSIQVETIDGRKKEKAVRARGRDITAGGVESRRRTL